MTVGISHFAIRKPTLRVGTFNIACWIVTCLFAFGGLYFLESLKPLLLLPIGFLIGFPIKDAGSPHAWVLAEWHARSQWKRTQGVRLHGPLTRKEGAKPTKLEQPELVTARVRERNGKLTELPLLTTPERTHVTMALETGGASFLWLRSDADGKYDWDLAWLEAMSGALSKTDVADLHVVMTRIHRPSNIEPGLKYNKSRGNANAIEAANSEDPLSPASEVDARIGKNAFASFHKVHGMAGEPSNYTFIRMPWPTRFGRKINLEDPDAFRKSSLFVTISEVMAAYKQNEIPASFVDLKGIRSMWSELLRLVDLPTMRMYQERDEALAHEPGEGPTNRVGLDEAVSIRHNPPKQQAWVDYDGSYHIAGYATRINRPRLPAGFQESAVVLSSDTFYALSTYIQATLTTSEATRTREKERFTKAFADINPANKGVSNPEQDQRIREVLEQRIRLADSSNRAANWYELASVVGDSYQEAEDRWNDMCVQLAGLYTFRRAPHPEDVEDILMAQIAVRVS